MIIGVGIDIIEVERIAEKMEKKQGFKELVFAAEEIAYCEPKTHKYEHYAARFAAKEAFLKALGTGWATGTAFNEIVVTSDSLGQPKLKIIGTTAITLSHISTNHIKISISHIKKMATAVVIIEDALAEQSPV